MSRSNELKISNPNDEYAILESCKDDIKECKNSLKKNFKKLAGRSFGAYQSKGIDKFFKYTFEAVKVKYFGQFVPNDEQIPICVIALGSYALNEMSVKSSIDFFISYKDLPGYNTKNIVECYVKFLLDVGLDINYKIYEINEIFDKLKDDLELKVMFYQIRYICASKLLYKETKNKILELKSYKKDEFIKFHLDKLKPYNEIAFLSQNPNLKSGYGGFNDYKRIYWLLNSLDGNTPKFHALKFISEKENSELNLSVDFISSLRSALHISGGKDELKNEFLNEICDIMQTKEKKMLEPKILLLTKTLSSMHVIAIYSRYLAKSVFSKFFRDKFSYSQLKNSRLKNGFYNILDTIYLPSRCSPKEIGLVIKSLNYLPDLSFKFDISVIFFLKRSLIDKSDFKQLFLEFKKFFQRQHAFGILKALLDSELLFLFIKPMEHTRHLVRISSHYKFSVDEYSLLCVYHLENIKDSFIKSLYDDLCSDGKVLIKLVVLMHSVGIGLVGDYFITGANIFRAYGNRLELSPKAINMGVNLIKNYALMNDVANTEDIYSQQTILNFISHIGEKQALKLLYILTYCIANAINDEYYNSYTAKLLRELYEISLENFDNRDENLFDEATRRVKKENLIKKQREFLNLSRYEQSLILNIPSNLLFIKYQPIKIIKLALWAKDCANIAIKIENKDSFCIKIITKYGWNMTMVLNKLSHLDLAYMEIFELFDGKFFVKLEYNKSANIYELENMETTIMKALCDKQKANTIKPLIFENEVNFDKSHSKIYAKININAKDQRGLMAYVLGIFEDFGIKVANARIQTIKNRTRNLFLIQKSENLLDHIDEILNLIITKN